MTDIGTPRTRTIAEIQEAVLATATPEVIVLPILSSAVRKACQDTVRILTATVTDRGAIHLALTGGSGGVALSEALASFIAAQPEEVRRAVHLWFGDERFVPAGGPECNDLLATPLIAIGIRESQIHRLAAPNEVGGLDEATARTVYELMLAGVAHGDFDVIHVGLGPDTHVCSLLPGYPAVSVIGAPAVVVRNSPKPSLEHYSLTFDVLQHAGRVMVVAGGEGKVEMARLGLGTLDAFKVSASRCRGKQTAWYLDKQTNALATSWI